MNKNINTNGRAALYASIYPAIERTCVANGWSSAVHGNIPVIYAGKSHHNRCMFGICITENMYLDISVIDDGTIGVEHLKKGMV